MEQAEMSTVIEAGSSSEVINSRKRLKREWEVGSIAKTEERVGKLLDQVISRNGEDLGGDRAKNSVVQHQLQIKPVNPQHTSLPGMPSDHLDKMNASGRNLHDRDSILSGVLNAFKAAKSRSAVTPSQSCNVASPKSSQSPLALTSSIMRHFSLRSRASKDLFSAQDIPTRSSALIPQKGQSDKDISIKLDGKFEDAYTEQQSSFVDEPVSVPTQSNAIIEAPEIKGERPADKKSVMGMEQHADVNYIPEDGSQKATKKFSRVNSRLRQHKCKTSEQPRMHKSNQNLRRHSLAVAGTSGEGGVRRSNRIRTRPLEYWRGERLLLGRVDESLVTVIGMKYKSSEDEQPDFKVKSYVPDKFKDLVEKAASH